MDSLQHTSCSLFGDDICQISADIKFEIKKLEAHCHWILRTEYELTVEHLTQLKAIYINIAEYYERLMQSAVSAFKLDVVASPYTHSFSSISKHALLESLNALQAAQCEMIICNTSTAKISYMAKIRDLCKDFAVLLEDQRTGKEALTLNTTCPVSCDLASKEHSVVTSPHNEKLESLFRALEG